MKHKTLLISSELFGQFLSDPVPPGLSSDFPKDGKIVGCRWSHTRRFIELLIEHDTFPETVDGQPPPNLEVHFTRTEQCKPANSTNA